MISRLFLACALASLVGGEARAEEGEFLSGTLKTVRDRGTLLVGVRDASVPFSFTNRAGQPVGFSVDLCHGIAADVAARLNRDLIEADAPAWQTGVRIAYVPVAAEARIPKLLAGEIDLECGSTTANAERAKSVAFSPVFFLAGTKVMVATESPFVTWRDLAGRTVAVSAGTTNAEIIRRLAGTVTPPVQVAATPGLDRAYAMLAAGKADAFASDDILLVGLIAAHHDGGRYRVAGDYLSYEPYAIAYRRDDAALADLVTASFGRMAQEGTLNTLYKRWLLDKLPSGVALNLPISPHLAEMYRALGAPD